LEYPEQLLYARWHNRISCECLGGNRLGYFAKGAELPVKAYKYVGVHAASVTVCIAVKVENFRMALANE
jgi:hypothetical protein